MKEREGERERKREKEGRPQPPFSPSVASLCHPWFTATNLSYRFSIFETSATALCGTTGIGYYLILVEYNGQIYTNFHRGEHARTVLQQADNMGRITASLSNWTWQRMQRLNCWQTRHKTVINTFIHMESVVSQCRQRIVQKLSNKKIEKATKHWSHMKSLFLQH